jgi:hypothetical protein
LLVWVEVVLDVLDPTWLPAVPTEAGAAPTVELLFTVVPVLPEVVLLLDCVVLVPL